MASRRRRFAPTPRRKKVWADHEGTGTTIAEDTSFDLNVLAGFITAGGSTQGATVIRTIIDLTWWGTAAVTAGDKLTLGLHTYSTGLGALADPINESYADWMFVKSLYAGAEHGLLGAGVPNTVHLDIHSARKLDEVGTSLWISGIYTAPGSATTANYKLRCRTLLLLP
jgi:hypothetical protein